VPAPAAVILPTAGRPRYLDVALASIVPQAVAIGADVLVVDDGPTDATRAIAARHGARYVAHDRSRGLNAARNTGARETTAPLLAYVDDDVEVHPGWLAALVVADAAHPADVGVFTGPILARFDDHPLQLCGREGPPITHLDLGPADRDCDHAWGANMAVRRKTLERIGPFDESRELYGDEQEWQARLKAGGGRVRYIAGARLEHRRAGNDARLPSLTRAAYRRGRASRRFDVFKGNAPSPREELRVLAGCLVHGPRFRCANGPILSAHSLGRLRSLLDERLALPPVPPATPGVDDFLSGRSGFVAGKRGRLLRAQDALFDLAELPARARRTRAARRPPRRRVLVVGIERVDVANLIPAARTELARSRHDVTVDIAPAGTLGKFENLDVLLARHDLPSFDWVIVMDDDVALTRGFLDTFLACAEAGGLRLAQPAHRRHSHAAWEVTRRQSARGRTDWRETTFVEIGPVTAFDREAAAALLPFPKNLKMGWGLDAHWSAVAQQRGWPIGVVDATPIGHTIRPAADGYPRETAAAEARRFLDGRPYVRRDDVRTVAAHRIADD
jgi:GT2 family glycosyltransferase